MNGPTHTEYAIGLEQLRALEGALAQAPEMVQRELLAAAAEADALIQREVQEAMPTAHGTLRASVFHEEAVTDTGVTGLVATPLVYGEPVELGTRPHFPPIEPLMDWVKVKLGIQGEVLQRAAAFAIAMKISRVGTAGQFPFRTVYERLEAQVRAIFDRAGERIAAQLTPGGAA